MRGIEDVPEEDRPAFEYFQKNPASLDTVEEEIKKFVASKSVQESLKAEIGRLVRSDLDLHPVVLNGLQQPEHSSEFQDAMRNLENKFSSGGYQDTILRLLEDKLDEGTFDLTPSIEDSNYKQRPPKRKVEVRDTRSDARKTFKPEFRTDSRGDLNMRRPPKQGAFRGNGFRKFRR